MKTGKRIPLLLLALSFVALFAFKTDEKAGVKFILSGWGDAVKASKEKDKPIFVFVRTQTCAVSKKMDMQVFRNGEVGNFFNTNFVCTQQDPDNVLDNLRVTNWGATGVPTYVFLNKKRKLVTISSGFKEPKEIIKLAQSALDKMDDATGPAGN